MVFVSQLLPFDVICDTAIFNLEESHQGRYCILLEVYAVISRELCAMTDHVIIPNEKIPYLKKSNFNFEIKSQKLRRMLIWRSLK